MRRLFVTALVVLAMIGGLVFTASASTAPVSMEFVPRAPKGTVFYLDIHSEDLIGAAVFELSFDDEVVEYRSVSGSSGASVQAAEQDGVVRIAYGHPSGGSGSLLRLTFNALVSAETEFTLHPSQEVDGDNNYLTDVPDYYLTADVGRQVKLSSGTTTTHAEEKSGSDKAATSSKSAKSGNISEHDDDSDDDGMDEEEPPVYTIEGEQSLSNRDSGRWFVIGMCAAVMVLILIGAAVYTFMRYRKKPNISDMQEGEDSDTEPDTEQDNSDTE